MPNRFCASTGPNHVACLSLRRMDFATKLSRLMRLHGDTNESLAQKLAGAGAEASRELVRRVVGGADPRLGFVRAVAEVYAVPVAYLADDAIDEPAAAPERISDEERDLVRLIRRLGHPIAWRRLTLSEGDPVIETRPPHSNRGRNRRAE